VYCNKYVNIIILFNRIESGLTFLLSIVIILIVVIILLCLLFCLFCCFFTNCCRKIKEKEIEHMINTGSSDKNNTYEEIKMDSITTGNRKRKLKHSDDDDRL